VQSQVDLAMRSIQVLQKEHVLLVKSITGDGGSSVSANSTSVMGPAPSSSLNISSPTVQPQQLQLGDHTAPSHLHLVQPPMGRGILIRGAHGCLRWTSLFSMVLMSGFGWTNVLLTSSCVAYPPDFRVKDASLHMIGRASHWF
jgi:hypothetical protein